MKRFLIIFIPLFLLTLLVFNYFAKPFQVSGTVGPYKDKQIVLAATAVFPKKAFEKGDVIIFGPVGKSEPDKIVYIVKGSGEEIDESDGVDKNLKLTKVPENSFLVKYGSVGSFEIINNNQIKYWVWFPFKQQ